MENAFRLGKWGRQAIHMHISLPLVLLLLPIFLAGWWVPRFVSVESPVFYWEMGLLLTVGSVAMLWLGQYALISTSSRSAMERAVFVFALGTVVYRPGQKADRRENGLMGLGVLIFHFGSALLAREVGAIWAGSPLLLAAASWFFWLNLVVGVNHLLPVKPFSGGYVAAGIAQRWPRARGVLGPQLGVSLQEVMLPAGIIAVVITFVATGNVLLSLVLFACAWMVRDAWQLEAQLASAGWKRGADHVPVAVPEGTTSSVATGETAV